MEYFYSRIRVGLRQTLSVARKLRVEYSGAIYHVMNRKNRREPIFQDDTDRQLFLDPLAEACRKTGWPVHGYCLMSNHLPVPSTADKFSPGGGNAAGESGGGDEKVLGTSTDRFNRKHRLVGHLFSGRAFQGWHRQLAWAVGRLAQRKVGAFAIENGHRAIASRPGAGRQVADRYRQVACSTLTEPDGRVDQEGQRFVSRLDPRA